jgi:hypothetical protein
MDKTNLFLIIRLQPLGTFSHITASRTSSKITRKMDLKQEVDRIKSKNGLNLDKLT